jgi:hypothetical protein
MVFGAMGKKAQGLLTSPNSSFRMCHIEKEDYTMKRSTEQTAVLVALLLKRSGQKRARLSENTIRVLSRRRTLRDAFKERLRAELDDIGLHLVQLERGGFGIIPINALDGAVAITAKKYLSDDLRKLKKSDDDAFFEKLRREVDEDADEGDEGEE